MTTPTTGYVGQHWNCGDCGNIYDPDVEHCPNTRTDVAAVETRAKDIRHNPICPRFRIFCDCEACSPPACLCDVIDAVRRHDRKALRQAFYEAR